MANTPTHTQAKQLALILATSLGLGLLLSVVTSVNANADERRSSSQGYQLNHNAQIHRHRTGLGDWHTNSHRPYRYSGMNYGYGLAPRYGTSISFGWSSLGSSYNSGYPSRFASSPWDYRFGRSWGADPWNNDYDRDNGYHRNNYWHQAQMTPRRWQNSTYLYPAHRLILNGEQQGYDDGYDNDDDTSEYGFNNTGSYASESFPAASMPIKHVAPIPRETTNVNYSSGLTSLPENARVIQLENGTAYEWQGVQYRFDWATQTYQKVASEQQGEE